MLLDDDSLLEKMPLVKEDEKDDAGPLPVKVHIDATTLWWRSPLQTALTCRLTNGHLITCFPFWHTFLSSRHLSWTDILYCKRFCACKTGICTLYVMQVRSSNVATLYPIKRGIFINRPFSVWCIIILHGHTLAWKLSSAFYIIFQSHYVERNYGSPLLVYNFAVQSFFFLSWSKAVHLPNVIFLFPFLLNRVYRILVL